MRKRRRLESTSSHLNSSSSLLEQHDKTIMNSQPLTTTRQSPSDDFLASQGNAHLVSPIDASEQLYHHQYSPSSVNAPSIWTICGDFDDIPQPLPAASIIDSHPGLMLMVHHGRTSQPSHNGKTMTSPVDSNDSNTYGPTDVSENLRHSDSNDSLLALLSQGVQGRFLLGRDSHGTLFSASDPLVAAERVIHTKIDHSKANCDAHSHHNNNNKTTTTMTASKQPIMPQSIISQEDQGPYNDWFVGHHTVLPRSRSRAIAIKRTPNNHKIMSAAPDAANEDDDEAGTSNDQMYDYATWRMYHRIIDHRQKHPVPEDYRPATVPSSSSSSGADSSSQHHQNNLNLPTSLRPKVNLLSDLDDVIFDMDF